MSKKDITPQPVNEKLKSPVVTTPQSAQEENSTMSKVVTTTHPVQEENSTVSTLITTPKLLHEEKSPEIPQPVHYEKSKSPVVITPQSVQEEEHSTLSKASTTPQSAQEENSTMSTIVITPKSVQKEKSPEIQPNITPHYPNQPGHIPAYNTTPKSRGDQLSSQAPPPTFLKLNKKKFFSQPQKKKLSSELFRDVNGKLKVVQVVDLGLYCSSRKKGKPPDGKKDTLQKESEERKPQKENLKTQKDAHFNLLDQRKDHPDTLPLVRNDSFDFEFIVNPDPKKIVENCESMKENCTVKKEIARIERKEATTEENGAKKENNLARIMKKENFWKKLELKKESSGKKSSRKKTSVEDKLRTDRSLKLGLSPTSKKIGNVVKKLNLGKKVGQLRTKFEGGSHLSKVRLNPTVSNPFAMQAQMNDPETNGAQKYFSSKLASDEACGRIRTCNKM